MGMLADAGALAIIMHALAAASHCWCRAVVASRGGQAKARQVHSWKG